MFSLNAKFGSFLGDRINEFAGLSLDPKNLLLQERETVLATEDSPCINPLAFCISDFNFRDCNSCGKPCSSDDDCEWMFGCESCKNGKCDYLKSSRRLELPNGELATSNSYVSLIRLTDLNFRRFSR